MSHALCLSVVGCTGYVGTVSEHIQSCWYLYMARSSLESPVVATLHYAKGMSTH